MDIFQVLGTFLLIMLNGALALITTKLTRLPLTLNVLFWGIISAALVPISGIDTGVRAESFEDLVLYVLVPVLVFEAALNIHTQLLKPLLSTILFSATIGVLVATCIAAAILYIGIDHATGFPIVAALIAGLVISATDPVAVVSQLKDSEAPPKLATLIEGESLFNDATALVLFGVLLAMALGNTEASVSSGLLLFLKVLIGGALVGLLAAWLGKLCLKLIANRADSFSFVSLGLVYASFYVSEHLLDVSGVIAVLVLALVIKNDLLANRASKNNIQHSWELFAFIANISVFWLMGLVVTFGMFADRWIAILLGIAAAFLSRLIAIYLSVFVGKILFRQDIDWRFAPVMIWGGSRGVITIALVLSLPLELPYWYTIQSIGFGVVLFTLVVQATSNPLLLKKLKLS